jgi:hypothetical protein
MIIYVIEKFNDYIVALTESHVHILGDILACCDVRSDATSLDTPCIYPSVMQCFEYYMGRCDHMMCDIALKV